jgi:hypothetical protein
MQEAMQLHRVWSICAVIAAVLSAVDVTVKPSGIEVAFRVDVVTATLVALVWLPSLLKIIAWTGGTFKTPAGEASSGGLFAMLSALPPDARTDALSTVAASLADVERRSTGAHQAEAARALTSVRKEIVSAVEQSRQPAADRFAELARQYDVIRDKMDSGPTRTRQMSALVEQAQAAAQADIPAALAFLTGQVAQFDQLKGGWRVVTLAVLRALPIAEGVPALNDALLRAESPFEQYQALRACEAILDKTGLVTARPLKPALEAALAGRGTIPVRASDREPLTTALIRSLS